MPVLSPLRRTPALQQLFSQYIVDRWPTRERLENFIRKSSGARLFLLHAKDDFEIPFQHSEALFRATANATMSQSHGGVLNEEDLDRMVERRTVKGDNGDLVRTWATVASDGKGRTLISEEVTVCGGHNRVMTYSSAALTVWRAFGLDEAPRS